MLFAANTVYVNGGIMNGQVVVDGQQGAVQTNLVPIGEYRQRTRERGWSKTIHSLKPIFARIWIHAKSPCQCALGAWIIRIQISGFSSHSCWRLSIVIVPIRSNICPCPFQMGARMIYAQSLGLVALQVLSIYLRALTSLSCPVSIAHFIFIGHFDSNFLLGTIVLGSGLGRFSPIEFIARFHMIGCGHISWVGVLHAQNDGR